MERAYNAETERGLRVIRYDYRQHGRRQPDGRGPAQADID